MTRLNTSSSSSKVQASKKRLRFDRIEIIEFPISLGDNPCVKDGPPLTCCWDAQLRVMVNLDAFEQCRPKRRPAQKLLLSRRTREKLLLKHGYSDFDIAKATLEAKRVRLDRMISNSSSSSMIYSTASL